MATIHPFRALRPLPEVAREIASVPYDVVDSREARALAAGKPRSFLHVTKPEIDLQGTTSPHDEAVYAQGRRALDELIEGGHLVRDPSLCLYVYELTMGKNRQTGVVMCADVGEYERNVVRKHEHTRLDKENDRVAHMQALGAQSGKVFLVHRDSRAVAAELLAITARPPAYDFVAEDCVHHRFWVVSDDLAIARLVAAFAALDVLYIADGHHRSAAAARYAASKRRGAAPDPAAPYESFLAVAFPASEVQILPYNRVVKDLGAHTRETFLDAVRAIFMLREGKPEPTRIHDFGMFLDGAWYTLAARPGTFDEADPVGRLDVSILQAQLLAPILGITDPRRDERIDFVGGIRGDSELERRVRAGWAVAFKLHPTAIEDLFAIADAGAVMPPKSTWFEPKLRDGLVVHEL